MKIIFLESYTHQKMFWSEVITTLSDQKYLITSCFNQNHPSSEDNSVRSCFIRNSFHLIWTVNVSSNWLLVFKYARFKCSVFVKGYLKLFNSLLFLKRFQNPSMTSMFSNSLYIHCLLHTFHSSLPTLYKSNDLILLRFHPKSHLPSSPSPYNLFDEDINQTFKPEPMRSGS